MPRKKEGLVFPRWPRDALSMFKRLAAACLLAMPIAACATVPEPTEMTQKPATVVVAFDREGITPLIVEGVRNKESGEAVEANDPARIASISKLIMALATLRLMDEGKVNLNADVSDYLGWKVRSPHHPDAKVTLAQLLGHRSGLRDNAGYVIPLGESLEAKLKDPEAWYANAPPGEAPFEYANLGSSVVASVLEAATGERYDFILQRTVFSPLGVEGCVNWTGCSDDMVARAVTLYRDTGEVARDAPDDLPPNCTIPAAEGFGCSLDFYRPGTNASIFSPQGGVRIGMMDLARIGQEMLKTHEDSFLSGDALSELFFSVLPRNEGQEFFCRYGLGLQIIQDSGDACVDYLFLDGLGRFGHAGEAYGLRSGLWFNPRVGAGFAYFTTAVPPRQGGEDEGGFSKREIQLMSRAQELLATKANN